MSALRELPINSLMDKQIIASFRTMLCTEIRLSIHELGYSVSKRETKFIECSTFESLIENAKAEKSVKSNTTNSFIGMLKQFCGNFDDIYFKAMDENEICLVLKSNSETYKRRVIIRDDILRLYKSQ